MMSVVTIILGVVCIGFSILVDKAVKDASKTVQDIAIKNFVTYKKR